MTAPPVGTVLALALRHEHDVVAARQRSRQVAGLLGFDAQDQTRIATAVSEIARNAFTYAGGGQVTFLVEGRTAPQVFAIRVADQGPGIPELDRILAGTHRSPSGMGVGIAGTRRLMDRFAMESTPGRGTTVWLRKILPRQAPLVTPARQAALVDALARHHPESPLEEVQQQNRELLRALDELRRRQEELSRLNSELEDTNRGVVALLAELDEKADHLRRADDMKTRFLSNMSHEFRTPLNSVLALSRLLLGRTDGELTPEQEKQVGYIRRAAEDLSELVNDLLDIAKVEAGKTVVRPVEFEVASLFGALRGMLRPLLVNESVALVFEVRDGVPALYTDEGKVSQILRNFISNALKFTERGQVRVTAAPGNGGEHVVFAVADSGIGIAPADQERIFQEFGQLDNPVQRRVRGTGLGLPLAKRLTELLGGRLTLVSEPGVGSTFSAILPVRYAEPEVLSPPPRAEPGQDLPVLVVEDSAEDSLVYKAFFAGSRFAMVRAPTVKLAREALRRARPVAVVLDIRLRGEDTWAFLAEIKGDEATRDLPVLVVSTTDDRHKGLGLGADAYAVKPVSRDWLLETLTAATASPLSVLLIDDDAATRYLLRSWLPSTRFSVSEAADGAEGLQRARRERPDAIVLDLVMPGLGGAEVLEALKGDEVTRPIPVVVMSSQVLEADDHQRLAAAAAVLSKATAFDRLPAVLVRAARGEPSHG